jgi:hypothetical protein
MKFLCIVTTFLFVSFSVVADEEKSTTNYEQINYKALSKLMWTYGVHDPKNNEIIDHYLAINNCDLYARYNNDAFLWQRIREGARREIDYYAHDYLNRFEITAVVPLDRYDFEKSAFIITEEFSLANAGAIQVPINGNVESQCNIRDRFSFFPVNVKFAADNKFSLKEIPVSPSQAQEILNRIKKYKYTDLESPYAVPLKFRVKINDVRDYKWGAQMSQVTFEGQLDDITFYEDPQMTKQIWKKSFKILE